MLLPLPLRTDPHRGRVDHRQAPSTRASPPTPLPRPLAGWQTPEVAVMLVFAEECSIHAEKAPPMPAGAWAACRLVVNCDVPGLANIEGWPLEQCGIRITEGGRLMDPSSALRVHGELVDRGIPIALGAPERAARRPCSFPSAGPSASALPAEEAHGDANAGVSARPWRPGSSGRSRRSPALRRPGRPQASP